MRVGAGAGGAGGGGGREGEGGEGGWGGGGGQAGGVKRVLVGVRAAACGCTCALVHGRERWKAGKE